MKGRRIVAALLGFVAVGTIIAVWVYFVAQYVGELLKEALP